MAHHYSHPDVHHSTHLSVPVDASAADHHTPRHILTSLSCIIIESIMRQDWHQQLTRRCQVWALWLLPFCYMTRKHGMCTTNIHGQGAQRLRKYCGLFQWFRKCGVMLRATSGQQPCGQWLVKQISTQAMLLFMMWFMLFSYNWAEFKWWGKNHPYSPNIDNLKGRTISPEISSQVHYKGTFY